MNKFNKFFRSKNGRLVAGLLGLLVIIAAVIVIWVGDISGLFGSGGLSTVPTSCLPTCDVTDSKMFILAGSDQASMSNTPIKIWIMVPGDHPSFVLGIFDGDTGKSSDNTLKFYANGLINSSMGNWDDAFEADTTYTLYADPLADGSGKTVLASWLGNDVMLNNAWWETTVKSDEQARGPNKHFYYRLEATRDLAGRGGQAFKVRASGYLTTGQREEWAVGLTGAVSTLSDIKIVYPDSNGLKNLGSKTTYDGDWQLYFYIPSNASRLELWDGDFDRGTSPDTDDPNTNGKPAWSTGVAVDEGIGGAKHDGVGRPNDDAPLTHFRVSPPVAFELIDPSGNPIYTNDNPSGTEEWEKFVISMDVSEAPDLPIDEPLKAGMYTVHITGLDLHNAIWISANYQICDGTTGCPLSPWEWDDLSRRLAGTKPSCQRTIGYWKNNVKKIYIENKTKGVQESKASLNAGLRSVALGSKLYRSGIDVNNPVPIDVPTPLTPQEANAILQKANGNSMLDRALQQNLATWMNLATGKIMPNSHIRITGIAGGDFSGTMMEALRYSEDIMLDPAKRADAALLERAKDIADMINNNALTTDKTENNETDLCAAYADNETGVTPQDQQPPKHDKMPKGPKPEPQPVEPGPAPICSAGNTYKVENTTDNPFYSVKFEFASGTEVKGGSYDTFKYTLPAEAVTNMESMQVEAKASTDSRTYDLACDFTDPAGCLPVGDDAYAVSFDGATDNGDGTYTLTFTVFVYGEHGLSHVSFGLPEGQTAGGLTGNYTAESCE